MKLPFTKPPTHLGVDLLSAYADGQGTLVERAWAEQHLAACVQCRAELTSLRQTVALLRALPRVAVPRAFTLSEAKLGIRRAERPAWFGGLTRGLAAVTALALVLVVTGTLLQRSAWTPAQTVARVAPGAALAPAPQAAVEAPPVAAQPAFTAPAAEQPPASEAAKTTDKAAAGAALPTQQPPTPAPAARSASATAAPTAAPAPKPVQPTAQAAPTAAPAAPTVALAEKSGPALALAPTAPPETRAAGMGGGEPQGAAANAGMTPEALPPAAPITAALPSGVRIAYAAATGLWGLDRATGVRQLAAGDGISAPLVSPDGAWIAYRQLVKGYFELRLVRADGSAARLLLNEAELPRDGLPRGYTERRLQNMQWLPGAGNVLALRTVAPSGAAASSAPVAELWRVDAETGVLQRLLALGITDPFSFSPDGRRLAVWRASSGQVVLYNADGSAESVALSVPGAVGQDRTAHLQWLPDATGLWVAAPVANGLALYRLTASGETSVKVQLAALDVLWSPDGKALAYTRTTSGAPATPELYLAAADGSGAQRYATLRSGAFLGWSPDGARFLYQDQGQVYVGAAGAAPVRVGNAVSVLDPRWLTPTQFIYLHDTNTGGMLALRDVAGKAFSLLLLPRAATFDVAGRIQP